VDTKNYPDYAIFLGSKAIVSYKSINRQYINKRIFNEDRGN